MRKSRPMWQRVVFPFVGAILIIAGLIGWLVPVIPGFFLAIIGVPLLFAFSSRLENSVREMYGRVWRRIRYYILRR